MDRCKNAHINHHDCGCLKDRLGESLGSYVTGFSRIGCLIRVISQKKKASFKLEWQFDSEWEFYSLKIHHGKWASY